MPKKTASAAGTTKTPRRKRAVPPKGWQRVFLRELSRLPFVQPACRKARVARQTAYRMREKSKAFAKAWDNALAGAVDDFEASCFEWAKRGIKTPITYKGQITAAKLERSQYLAGIFLRGFNPDRYADPKQNIGANASPVDVAAQIRAAVEMMRLTIQGPPPTPETPSPADPVPSPAPETPTP